MAIGEIELTHFAARLDECPAAQLPEFALSGRSNVGKSSLINYLVGKKRLAHTSGQPGKTRCFVYYCVDARWNLVDMPGYGYAKVPLAERKRWLKSALEFYRERKQLRGVFQLIDLGVGPTKDDIARAQLLTELGHRLCVVFTKSDKVGRSQHDAKLREALSQLRLPPETGVVLSSAKGSYGDSELRAWIVDQLAAR